MPFLLGQRTEPMLPTGEAEMGALRRIVIGNAFAIS